MKDVAPMATLDRPELLRCEGYIAGRWTPAISAERITVFDPATLAAVGTVAAMGEVETRSAVDAAAKALPAWRARPAEERADILHAWKSAMLAHASDLAKIITTEQGKPLGEALGEIDYASRFVGWFAEEARRIYGDVIPGHNIQTRILVTKQPVGVVAAITPWNFPAAMVTRKVAAALAAGCTVVLKPSELTPLTALALTLLAEEAGVPAGVLNVVNGWPQIIGPVLTAHPQVRKLTFTGSTAIGKLLAEQCAPTLKRLSLELGGNAPFLVFDDADLALAEEGLIQSKFRNTGQTCVCANRIFVQSGVYDRFAQMLAERVKTLRTGPGSMPGVEQGPLIDERALRKVERHVSDAVARGAKVLVGGHPLGGIGAGAFFAPTVLINATEHMALAAEETFGPVAPLFRFDTEAEALALANAATSGLAAYVFTNSMRRSLLVAESLETGMVGINTGRISSELIPFGGIKESGYGREGSKYGIGEYLDIKCIAIGDIQ